MKLLVVFMTSIGLLKITTLTQPIFEKKLIIDKRHFESDRMKTEKGLYVS